MYEEDEVEIPIYLITGFLESGKTSFINFTVAQDYFQDGVVFEQFFFVVLYFTFFGCDQKGRSVDLEIVL